MFRLNPHRLVILLIVFGVANFANGQNRYIELQIYANGMGELGAQQRAMEALSEVGADRVNIKTARGVAPVEIRESESGDTIVVTVSGMLDGRRLRLPGATYALNDTASIKDFLQKLRDDGATVAMADKLAFGLTSTQLVEVYDRFGAVVEAETKGQSSSVIVVDLVSNLNTDVDITDAARNLLNDTPILEEYSGLSTGTTLAGILRPLGLVIAPKRNQGEDVKFLIAASGELDEHWPIGWPIEKAPVEVEPRLFEKLDQVQINDFALQDAMDVIQQRVGVPFLYDQNGIARGGIEMTEVKVTLLRDRMMYFTILRKLLNQTKPKLALEIRQDENGKPFVWVYPQQ